MKNYNLLPLKYVFLSTFKKNKSFHIFSITIFILAVLIITGITMGLAAYQQSYVEKVANISVEQAKYDSRVKESEELKQNIAESSERIEYLKSLDGKFTNFSNLLTKLTIYKPRSLYILAIEEASLVPPPDLRANDVKHLEVSDITQNKPLEDLPSTTTISTEADPAVTAATGAAVTTTDTAIAPADTTAANTTTTEAVETSPATGTQEANTAASASDKYANMVKYTKDIGVSNIIISGYSKSISDISLYINQLAKIDAIEGYTMEGIEDRITILPNVNVILFELKLNIREGN